jgi:hypothetical protein
MVNSISWRPKDDELRQLVMTEVSKSSGFSDWAKSAFKHYLECEENSRVLSNIDEADKFFDTVDSMKYTEKVKCINDERSGHYRIPRNNPCSNINCQYDVCDSYKMKQMIKEVTNNISWINHKPDARFITRLWQDVAIKYEDWCLSFETRDLFKNQILNYKELRDSQTEYFIIWLKDYITSAGYELKA